MKDYAFQNHIFFFNSIYMHNAVYLNYFTFLKNPDLELRLKSLVWTETFVIIDQ